MTNELLAALQHQVDEWLNGTDPKINTVIKDDNKLVIYYRSSTSGYVFSSSSENADNKSIDIGIIGTLSISNDGNIALAKNATLKEYINNYQQQTTIIYELANQKCFLKLREDIIQMIKETFDVGVAIWSQTANTGN